MGKNPQFIIQTGFDVCLEAICIMTIIVCSNNKKYVRIFLLKFGQYRLQIAGRKCDYYRQLDRFINRTAGCPSFAKIDNLGLFANLTN